MPKFNGTIDNLKHALETEQLQGDWSDDGNGKHTFRQPGKGGDVINWWESTGTIQIQGKADIKAALEAAVENATNGDGVSAFVARKSSAASSGRQIFVVHGHDSDSRDQLELVLRRLGLEPFILMNSSGGGLTIIEALEGKIGHDYSADFGIVLLTPDDMGYAKKDGPDKAEPRARQNVILEIGMLLSSLTRSRMALVARGHLEIPSDLQGIIRLSYNDHIRQVVPKLCQRLREAGFDIDAGKVSDASA